MQIITLFIIIIFLPLILVRLLRWLAWSQQKEYRADRLWQFLLSEEGLYELLRVIPQRTDFTRVGMKRPTITIRASATGFLSLTLVSYVLTTAYFLGLWWLPIAVYLLAPVFPGIISFISEIFKSSLSFILLFLAHQKVASTKPKIIGITGSYGKTTTRHLVAHVLTQQFTVFTPIKSHNTPLAIAWSILRHYRGEEILFLEFAAYKKGEIRRLARWFTPELSIITGVTHQHLALFGSLENIIKAKGELVKATKLDGQVFYNGSDELALKVCEQDSSKKAVAYAGPKSIVSLTKVRLNEKGKLQFSWQGKIIQTHLSVLYATKAIQAAIGVGEYFQIPSAKIRLGLTQFLPTENYLQVYQHQQGFTIINDGKTSNPEGFLGALELLGHFKKQGKNTLLLTSGIIDLGDQSDEIHLKLAKAAKEVADLVLYTGIDGLHIFREVFGADMTNRTETIRSILEKLNKEDVLLVEGHAPVWLQKLLVRTYD
ncbi:MAG: Mur ligase family protein [Candidatus Paceibacterota bacterium]